MASAAGTMSQRLNSLGAMIAPREKIDMDASCRLVCINYERNHISQWCGTKSFHSPQTAH